MVLEIKNTVYSKSSDCDIKIISEDKASWVKSVVLINERVTWNALASGDIERYYRGKAICRH